MMSVIFQELGFVKHDGSTSNSLQCDIASDVRAWLGLARPDNSLRKSKPKHQALKSLSRPKPWAQAAALHM